VTDDGTGFDPAARTGSGFGLISMRERVRSVGGDIWIESQAGRGATVRVELPLDRSGGPDQILSVPAALGAAPPVPPAVDGAVW
jgi:glucose-6-phosphate-specific signal transduction histidine kinase